MNSKKAYKELMQAGIPEKQADAMTQVIDEAVRDGDLVTKEYLRAELSEVRTEIAQVKSELKTEIARVKNDLDLKIEQSEKRLELKIADTKVTLIKWIVGIAFTQSALILSVLALMR